jgi:hypothetical protein
MGAREYFLEDYLTPANDLRLNKDAQPPPQLNQRYRTTRAINEMLGICKGLLADGALVDSEVTFLAKWFQTNQDVLKNFPAGEIYGRISRIYEDGIVTDEEREDLKELLTRVTGGMSSTNSENVAANEVVRNASTTLPFDHPEPVIMIPGRSFSFTGKFVSGTRAWCVEQVLTRDGRFDERPTSGTYCLVIGALGSRDWAHTSFGRKIEAAMKFKPPMVIVSEQHWAKHLT